MGGKVAEEILNGPLNVSGGCSNDLNNATNIATTMVLKYGMSDTYGPIFREKDDLKKLSPKEREIIDHEVRELLKAGLHTAKDILTKNKHQLDNLAKALQENETLDASEVAKVLQMTIPKHIVPSPKQQQQQEVQVAKTIKI